MSKSIILSACLLLLVVPVGWALAHESQADLRDEAAISFDVARAAALSAVPGGRIVEEELEREGAGLIYAFDIEAPGDGSWRDVEIDAMTGVVVQNLVDDDGEDDDTGSDDDDDRDEGQPGNIR
jgi:hypothetical protein